MTNHCGSCTACCKVFAIPERLNKPANKWCQHCHIGVGCKIYEDRPVTCVEFECIWLQSQAQPKPFPAELRPDRSKVVFSATTRPDIMVATTMDGSPLAWQRKDVRALIDSLIHAGMKVVVGSAVSTTKTMITREGTRTVHMTQPDENGIQWNID